MTEPGTAEPVRLLKADAFGRIELMRLDGELVIRRDIGAARWWLRGLARLAAAREARALRRLDRIEGLPCLLAWDGRHLFRSHVPGLPMQQGRPVDPQYYRQALRLLAKVHAAGVVHNDLAKEPNWLVQPDGVPGLVDFQLASVRPGRGAAFRRMAREDIRHLLKHKRTYCPEALSARQRQILATPAWYSRLWRMTVKRLYKLVARRLFGYWDNEGKGRVRD